jgi:hypothetical protein
LPVRSGTAAAFPQALRGTLAPSPRNCGECPAGKSRIKSGNLRVAPVRARLDWTDGRLRGNASTFLGLAPAQVFPQFRGQPPGAAAGISGLAVFLVAHRGVIIPSVIGIQPPPLPCATGGRVAVSAAFRAILMGMFLRMLFGSRAFLLP